MMTPEPTRAWDYTAWSRTRPVWEDVPAAGHLGVIEEKCGAHWALEYAIGYRCSCGGVV